ncbi:MAG: prepilin-type N-terminal cleavage/methylation domain-containing protein [Candidatus Thiodiazotropha sp. (ex Lucinoma borealis)]|nr:prepilin-type N-terminal cleavage/methylation domain-containing protein [Candidatus Thiodiazotropha sp. (ex Lucinoma borealis)]MCU7866776.1 prepilin-type N-terminal cleavage/methylation domain-containing protein [Candidatus Thiodiazotropha sp. (ex Lucinoma borealis)]
MSSKITTGQGVTLVELLVVLVILSVLAAVAIPQAEVMVRRDKEFELRRSLRTIRLAIDQFHSDWAAGKIAHDEEYASDNGYPVNLEVLVEGVPTTSVSGEDRYYLRRIPADPFTIPGEFDHPQWVLRSYQDPPGSSSWGGQDVYDIRTESDKIALDRTYYNAW